MKVSQSSQKLIWKKFLDLDFQHSNTYPVWLVLVMNLTLVFHLCVLFARDKVLHLCSRKEWDIHQGFWIPLPFYANNFQPGLSSKFDIEKIGGMSLFGSLQPNYLSWRHRLSKSEFLYIYIHIFYFFFTVCIDCGTVTAEKKHKIRPIGFTLWMKV